MYANEKGHPALIVTFGNRSADLPGLPPSHYGRGELLTYVPAAVEAKATRSPLMDYEPPRQIARPKTAPSHTAYPSVQIEMRTSQHPGGNAEYITPGREPEAKPEPKSPEPQRELTESEAWWQRRMA
jgi:hypothetical protein